MEGALKAVSSKHRRRILQLVWDEELSSGEIAERFDLSWPAISQNLKILRDAGLVIGRRDGNRRLYRADRETLRPLEGLLRSFWGEGLDRLRDLAEHEVRGGNPKMASGPSFSVELETRVRADRAIVFSYFTDPAKFRRWQGIDAELDPRPGGLFRLRISRRMDALGEYLVVDPPRRLVFTWGVQVNDALPVGPMEVPAGIRAVAPGASIVEVDFVSDGTETVVRLQHTGLPTDEAVTAHRFGWSTHLPRLVIAAEGGDPGPEPLAEV